MRAINATAALVAAGHEVVLWSSDFYHQEKRHRIGRTDRIRLTDRLEVRLLRSPGYRRNIGPGRLIDHAVLGRELSRVLASESSVPDVALVGFPPIETAAVMIRWLSDRGVPSLLDVKDQWPAIFVDPLPHAMRPLGRLALFPYFALTRAAFREASAIASMSDGFLAWALEEAGRARRQADCVLPLAPPETPLDAAEIQEAERWWDEREVRADGTPRLMFVGSHSRAFDMDAVIHAQSLLAERGHRVEFILCGSGEQTARWKALVRDKTCIQFPGWVNRAQAVVLAARSIAALAPYRDSEDFRLSIPNKVLDALSLGLPVLSGLSGEVAKLLTNEHVGVRYDAQEPRSLADGIEELVRNRMRAHTMGRAARALYESRYHHDKIYGQLVQHLERLAMSGAARAVTSP